MVEKDKTSNWLIPLPEQYVEEDKIIERPFLVLFVVLFLLLTFGGLFWFGYMGRDSDGPIPVVLADAGPLKIQPDDPGGLKVKDQDKNIYDRLEGRSSDSGEKLRISSESPIDVPVSTKIVENADSYLNFVTTGDGKKFDEWLGKFKEKSKIKRKPAVRNKLINVVSKMAVIKKSYVIQFGAFGNKARAERLWKKLKAQNDDLDSLQLIFVPVKTDSKVIYRMQGGYIAERSRADELCVMLKRNKQACISVEIENKK